MDTPKPMSLRAYARRRGVSPEAVSKAVSDGRLRESVTREFGAPKIADPDLADREWEANTQPRGESSAPSAQVSADYLVSRALKEAAAARQKAAQAELAELELAERRGQLIDAEVARCSVIAAFSLVKTRLLAVPARLGQRLPEVADLVVPVIDELVREALEELAGGDGSRDE